jgi:hypothetical protein
MFFAINCEQKLTVVWCSWSNLNKLLNAVSIASVLILLSIGFSLHNARAETVHMYVEKIPQQWQEQFGTVLDEAVKYWQDKIPGLTFETVPFVDDTDFVVEWASQYDEGKLGYYSTNVNNAYGKPTLAITLGFFKDKEWHLVSHEYVLQITKHELGHALGLSHSDDPNDIMYPTIENYESWQQNEDSNLQSTPSEQELQAAITPSIDWSSKSAKYQHLAADKIAPLGTKIEESQSLLSSLSYSDKESQNALDNAWIAFWWAKKYLADSEKLQTDGGALALQSDYHGSYLKFKSSYDHAKKVEQKLVQIEKFVDKANALSRA